MTNRRRGTFITFEGIDGSGKSTQLRMLAERMRAQGLPVVENVEPGGTPIGRQIRRILLDSANQDLCPTAEMLLMFAARAQNVDQWILPALGEGKTVLSDRFTDSTLAYQGVGRGLGTEIVLDVDRIACRGLVPDLTIYIDIDAVTGLTRAHARNRDDASEETRLDEEEVGFYKKVREGYRAIAAEEPKRVRLIDGARSIDEIAADVWDAVSAFVVVTQ